MMIANVSTKINTSIGIVVINSRSKNNMNNMIMNTIIFDINSMFINLLV